MLVCIAYVWVDCIRDWVELSSSRKYISYANKLYVCLACGGWFGAYLRETQSPQVCASELAGHRKSIRRVRLQTIAFFAFTGACSGRLDPGHFECTLAHVVCMYIVCTEHLLRQICIHYSERNRSEHFLPPFAPVLCRQSRHSVQKHQQRA